MNDFIEREYSGEIRRTGNKNLHDGKRHNYVGMQGRVSVPELLAYLAENAPGVPLDEVHLNWTTVVWIDAPTPEEVAADAAAKARHAAYTEKWERETLAKLTAKYAAPEVHPAEPWEGHDASVGTISATNEALHLTLVLTCTKCDSRWGWRPDTALNLDAITTEAADHNAGR